MKTLRPILAAVALLAVLVCLPATADNTGRFNRITFRSLPPLAVGTEQGVSAAYAGVSNGWAVVAGGCNFPDRPAAEGGGKRYYSDIYTLNLTELYSSDASTGASPQVPARAWKKAGALKEASAYGVGVSVDDGIIIIGGTNGEKSLNRVSLLSVSPNSGRVSIKSLPPLPVGLDNMAGAYGNGYIYVAGGQTNGQESHRAFRLKYPVSLGNGKESGWEELPPFPGQAKLQPVAAVQQGSVGSFFYLIGGYNAAGTNPDGLRYDPVFRRWSSIAPIVINGKSSAVSGAAAVKSGASFIVCFGGVDKRIFDAALRRNALIDSLSRSILSSAAKPVIPISRAAFLLDSLQREQSAYMLQEPRWYRFNDKLLIYNTITDAWCEMDGLELLARAGAALVDYSARGEHHWILIDGESKPGIRSADVTDTQVSYAAHFGWLNWLVLIVYLLAMLGMGYYFMHREKSSKDFFTGGGRIPWWAAGISIFATMLSAITYMSIPAKAYATDWTYYPMQICILLISFPVIRYYLPFFRRLNVTTAYEYLERRFSYATRLMASLLFIVFMVARMALVLFLPSLAMEAVTGINIYTCIILMAIITIVYCTMGGMEAVVWGDVVQGIILVGGALLAAAYLIFQTQGGPSGFLHIALDNDKLRLFDWSLDWRSATFWVVILGGLSNNLISYTSDQTVIQRYLTTKDEHSAARGILTNGLMSVFVTIAFFTIGTGLYTFFKTHPAAMDITMAKTDAVFPFFMMSQLPAGVAGLLIAAVFAATMSTIASNINSISTAFTIDMYKKALPHSTDRRLLGTARVAGIVSGIVGMLIAILMATTDIQSLLDYFNTILGLLSGGIGALFMMGIFFPRIGKRAALLGFITGTLTVVMMNFFTQVHFLLFGFISIAVSVAVALMFSLIWPERKEQPGLTWKTLDKTQA